MAAAAAPSSKILSGSSSSSSCPVAGRPANPNSRSSEMGNAMRRSFSGNPFTKPSIVPNQRVGFNPNTPANSPSEYPRRNSVGRENIVVSLRDFEDKENGKDHNWKHAKIRSPATSKGTKNFMSPTISAASKMNASPRKKILVERNESARVSISSSEGKGSLVDDCEQPKHSKKKEVSFDSTITYLGDKEALEGDEEFDSKAGSDNGSDVNMVGAVTMGKDCVNLDPSFEISPKAPCYVPIPDLAPLDADPSMPPYDPKTNYLSPRPQFLHYKPNPLVDLYRNQERDGKRLEESFTAESSSDAEVSEEDSQSDNRETEESSSTDVSEEDQEKQDQEDKEELVPEPVSISTSCVVKRESKPDNRETEESSSTDVSEEDQEKQDQEDKEELVPEPVSISTSCVVKRESKPPILTRTKFIFFLLLVASGCLWVSVSNSPIMDPNVLNNLSFSEPYIPPEISVFAKNTLNGLALKFQQSLYHSLSFIDNLVASFRERHKLGPWKYANLTTVMEDGSLAFDHCISGAEILCKNNVPISQEIDIVELAEEDQVLDAEDYIAVQGDDDDERSLDEEEAEVVTENNSEVSKEPLIVTEEIVKEEDEPIQVFKVEEDLGGQDTTLEVSEECTVSKFEELITSSETEVIKPGNLVAEAIQENFETAQEVIDLQNEDAIYTETKSRMAENSDPLDLVADASDEQTNSEGLFPTKTAVEICLLISSLLTAIAFLYARYRTHPTPNAALPVEQMLPQPKKTNYSPISVAAEQNPSARNWEAEVDVVGESCPSEMSSSFQNSSAHSKKGLNSEAQSQGSKPKKSQHRRESLASSDYSRGGSPSYGSFTTYERIPIKHGNGEDEVITPVRRSSRIKSLVTSP